MNVTSTEVKLASEIDEPLPDYVRKYIYGIHCIMVENGWEELTDRVFIHEFGNLPYDVIKKL